MIKRCINLSKKNTIRIALYLANLLTIEHPRSLLIFKSILLRLAGLHVENPIFIDRGFRCINPNKIKIESFVSLGHDNHIWAFSTVKIGRYTQTAKDLLIIAGSHDIASFISLPNQEVTIGPGCWIGARATILGGVTIGKGCVIGAGSLVRTNIPDWSVAVGVPARVIRQREPADQIINPFITYSPKDL